MSDAGGTKVDADEVYTIFVEGLGTEPPKLPVNVIVVRDEKWASLLCKSLKVQFSSLEFSFERWAAPGLEKPPAWVVMVGDARQGVYGDDAAMVCLSAERMYRFMDRSQGASDPDSANRRPSEAQAAALKKLAAETPPLDEGSEDWISSKVAAIRLGVDIETLANRRSRGLKRQTESETFGVHDDWCFWRKRGKAHPFYYAPLMKQHAGQLAGIFPKNLLSGQQNRH